MAPKSRTGDRSAHRPAEVARSVRQGDRAETVLLAAIVVGLVATAVSWWGLLLGGGLVGLAAPTLRRALVTGLYFGFTVLVAFLVYLLVVGALGPYLAMGALFYLSVAIAVVVPTLSALAARGLTATAGA
jgi:hypothetical protein